MRPRKAQKRGQAPFRIQVAPGGMVFYVVNRGVGRMRLLDDDADYTAFERVIEETLDQEKGTCPLFFSLTLSVGRSPMLALPLWLSILMTPHFFVFLFVLLASSLWVLSFLPSFQRLSAIRNRRVFLGVWIFLVAFDVAFDIPWTLVFSDSVSIILLSILAVLLIGSVWLEIRRKRTSESSRPNHPNR